jgi:hypothetical protein
VRRAHKDVEYHVEASGRATDIFRDFDKAAAHAVTLSLQTGRPVKLDVVVWSRAGAKSIFGDYGAEQYDEDPDASVFQRIIVRTDNQGRVP